MVGGNNVNQVNWSLYLSDLGFSKTKLMIFSTFSREPLKTMRKSAVYEKFAKRERQNPYKSGN